LAGCRCWNEHRNALKIAIFLFLDFSGLYHHYSVVDYFVLLFSVHYQQVSGQSSGIVVSGSNVNFEAAMFFKHRMLSWTSNSN
jgi:hypothetical protein